VRLLNETENLILLPEIDPDLHGLVSPARYERFANVLTSRLRSAGVKITAEMREDDRTAQREAPRPVSEAPAGGEGGETGAMGEVAS